MLLAPVVVSDIVAVVLFGTTEVLFRLLILLPNAAPWSKKNEAIEEVFEVVEEALELLRRRPVSLPLSPPPSTLLLPCCCECAAASVLMVVGRGLLSKT
jgi:hypothetical protein